VALAALGLVVHGPRVALFALLATEVTSIGVIGWRLGTFAAGLTADLARRRLVLTCRDDGALAGWAGRLVQGNIVPLPSICAGLGAVALLAVLGLGDLPGVVALAPVMALLLAAPGSRHPHDGRSDWLAPVLLALSQYVYLAALGFARGVPGPIVFSLCALTAIWYANLAAPPRRAATRARKIGPGVGLGWESRMFIVTFTAIVGIANIGYLGLAVYLGLLICQNVMVGVLTPREGNDR